jgi:hypothetical protein
LTAEQGVFAPALPWKTAVLGEAFKEVEQDIHNAWASAKWPRTRERLHAELKALDKVKAS